MSGKAGPDPAFLNNVPTSSSSTASSSSTLSPSSPISSPPPSTSTSTFSNPSSSSTASSTSTSTPSKTTSLPSSTATASSGPQRLANSIYFYSPSTALAIVFSTAYLLLIPYHFYLSIYVPHIAKSVSQKHTYTIPLFVASVLSTLGFTLRIASAGSESGRASVGLYASSQTWIIVAPIFVCATLYLLLAHLIGLCLPEGRERVFLGVSPRWLGRGFVVSDVLSFVCQGAGSGIAASGNWRGKSKDLGTNILILGLACQLATFSVYMVVLGLFCKRVTKGRGGGGEHERRDFGFNPLVKQVVKGMWIASVFVEIRSLYRTVEFGMGVKGYLFTHEWPLWVFEAVPMWIALLVLGIYHPTKWLQQKRRSAFLRKRAMQGNSRK